MTGGDVKARVANARKDPTYLLAGMDIVATYQLLQRIFDRVRLELELKDHFGDQVELREWFLVPLAVIDEAIQRISDRSIGGFRYEPESARLVTR